MAVGETASFPEVAFVPLQPSRPEQDVAFVEVHVSVTLVPEVTVDELAVRLTVGAGVDGGGEDETATLADCCTEPPLPVHVNVYVRLAVMAPVDCVPVRFLFPAQSPEAVHPVALVEAHVSVELPPDATDVGLAENVSVGAEVSETAAVRVVVPPALVHARVKVVDATKGPTDWLPVVAFDPAQPLRPPLPVQDVALLLVQDSVVLPLSTTEAGLALNVTVGAGVDEATVMLTERAVLPPAEFEHVSVNVVFAVSAPLVKVPLVGREPLQPPEAVHEFASLVDHVSVVVPLAATDVGLAESVTEGCATPEPGE